MGDRKFVKAVHSMQISLKILKVMLHETIFNKISLKVQVQICSFIKPWTVCSCMNKPVNNTVQACSSWPAEPCSGRFYVCMMVRRGEARRGEVL